jgi:phosphatidate cytidylyltransferase
MENVVTNPLASPYFLAALAAIAGLLGVSRLVLATLARLRPGRAGDDVLVRRWRTWAIIAPTFALAVLAGPLPTLVLFSALAFQSLNEYARLVALPPRYRVVLLSLGLLAVPVALVSLDAFLALPALLLAVATLQPLLLAEEHGVRHLAFAVLGWGYIAWFLGHLILLDRYVAGGPGLLLVLGLAVALSDVGAFVVGRRFGRHPLAPRISPAKTWEGLVGNVAGAYLGAIILAGALPPQRAGGLLLILPAVVALAAVWGDLVESAIKREFRAKDAGAWLPGFGGLLDRLDSLLIAGPLVYYFLRLVG